MSNRKNMPTAMPSQGISNGSIPIAMPNRNNQNRLGMLSVMPEATNYNEEEGVNGNVRNANLPREAALGPNYIPNRPVEEEILPPKAPNATNGGARRQALRRNRKTARKNSKRAQKKSRRNRK
jgi:hypothetical protein